MSGFNASQLKKLAGKLDRAHVQSRVVGGERRDYLEGWFVIAEANAIFGFGGWDREMVHCERLYASMRHGLASCGFLARVRVRVRAGGSIVCREGTGFGSASDLEPAEAYERAIKSAETDATKRALVTFGNRFGLGLYDKLQQGVTAAHESSSELGARFELRAEDGEVLSRDLSAEAFCRSLRQLAERHTDRQSLADLKRQNGVMIARLRAVAPQLRSARGEHYADILERVIDRRCAEDRALMKGPARPSKPAPDTDPEAGPVHAPAGAEDDLPLKAKGAGQTPAPGPGTGVAAEAVPGASGAGALPASAGSHSVPNFGSRPPAAGRVDKSVLAHGSDRRIRCRAHLLFVASKPCLVCEETPCHAHHVTFAQRRGLSQKVSDEFTVPLCVIHHNALHMAGNERAWWRAIGTDPLVAAKALWQETLAADTPLPTD